MEKSPLAVVRAAKDGRLIEIEQDVLDVCAQIKDISPSLGVEYNEGSGQFRVYELGRDHKRRTVFWTPALTGDIPAHLRAIQRANYVEELERRDVQAERDKDHRLHERIGEAGEKLAHAARKDRGVKGRAFVSREIR